METKYGIYSYVDKENGKVVYIGSDSNIDRNRRDIEHRAPSRANVRGINTELAKNPDKYVYVVLAKCLNKDIMSISETALINQFKPKFNIKKDNSD